MAVNYKLKNILKILSALDKADESVKKVVELTVANTAINIEYNAVREVKKVEGILASAIFQRKTDDRFTYEVGADLNIAPYAPYVEFGTGEGAAKYVPTLPQSLQDIAITFKGKGIREVNLPARPYLYPALVKGRQFMVDELVRQYDRIVKT